MADLLARLLDPEKVEAAIPALVQGIYENIRANLAVPEVKAAVDTIRELHRRLAAAKADLEDISEAFPDDATHKHEVTGESLVDNVRDALRDLAKAKADLAATREEIARLIDAVRGFRCTCYCRVHGGGCGGQEATCRGIVQCERCKAIDAARAGGAR